MKNIPLIIPVFNQLTYLRNLINWWWWYNGQTSPIFIVDNGSTYGPLDDFYDELANNNSSISVFHFSENDFIPNMKFFLSDVFPAQGNFDYYVISDPDIMPHPNTPMNFLEIWKNYIENHSFHHVGFNLITSDIPDYFNDRAMVTGNEAEFTNAGRRVVMHGSHSGYKAPIDTTFAMYSTRNGGWPSSNSGKDWDNSLRLFEAFHLGWYIDGEKLNPEMKNYFETCRKHIPGEPSAGKNNNRPTQYK